ncbi:MAG: 16S rRNA (guanine(527)-N(7))-methyltransferase RsmG [Cyanobacteria bacterium SIG30]|nr:16S rRNA (guanine(527)-N(7))-methyltransferase RsmG [Cyanobacteria bacterium SIG30]
MNKKQIELIEKNFNIEVTEKINSDIDVWLQYFNDYNSHTNLISKGDLKNIFEKHIFDSLALVKYLDLNKNYKIIDVGTGGGFPSVILAIFFRNLEIIAVDSVGKKINFIKEIKEKLNLKNLDAINDRIENLKIENVDFIVSRAVGRILKIYDFSKKHLNKNSKTIFYKSANYEDEVIEFKTKYNKKIETVSYILPTDEQHQRRLIIISEN